MPTFARLYIFLLLAGNATHPDETSVMDFDKLPQSDGNCELPELFCQAQVEIETIKEQEHQLILSPLAQVDQSLST